MVTEEKVLLETSPSQIQNFWLFLSCIFILPIPFALWAYYKTKNVELKLTNQRLITREGVFTKISMDFELYKLRDLAVQEPFLFRYFGAGNVIVFSNDSQTPYQILTAYEDPQELKDLIRNAAEQYKQDRKWGSIM